MEAALDLGPLLLVDQELTEALGKKRKLTTGLVTNVVRTAAEDENPEPDSLRNLIEHVPAEWYGHVMVGTEIFDSLASDANAYAASCSGDEAAKRLKFTRNFIFREQKREEYFNGFIPGPPVGITFDSVPFQVSKTKSKRKVKSLFESDEVYVREEVEKDEEEYHRESPVKKNRKAVTGRPGTLERAWSVICRQEMPRAVRQAVAQRNVLVTVAKKAANSVIRELRRRNKDSILANRDSLLRGRRVSREVLQYWRNRGKDLTKQQKQEQESARRKEEEAREADRQKKKLNFLLNQTELYGHFMSKKGNAAELLAAVPASDDPEEAKKAQEQTLAAVTAHRKHLEGFDSTNPKPAAPPQPTGATEEAEYPQPRILKADLKSYQLKGMNWLINLYDQGINGILADEMGLGKTVQTISFLTHLAENKDIWGPFLVISPLSTLHNWKDEFAKFSPELKVVPYWGSVQQRKVIRKLWKKKHLNKRNGAMHVLISSYAVAVNDAARLQKINWQYLVLDEAQAIKSSDSLRWKSLLKLNCRNRLLLTGTPIQNNMAELWALLHFVMPTLFDSHEEFYEWFSKDIENHAANSAVLDDHQLNRLRLVLKPFMLRRVKRDVESELPKKFELVVECPLTPRQSRMYSMFKSSALKDLIHGKSDNSLLQNIIMRLRQICNHPNILEKVDSGLGTFFFSPRERLVGRTSLAVRRISPVSSSPVALGLPVLLFLSGTPALIGSYGASPTRLSALRQLSVWRTAGIYASSLADGMFAFVRLTEFTAAELNSLFYDLDLTDRFQLQQKTQHDLANRRLPLSEICEQTLDRRVPLCVLVTLPQQMLDQPLLTAVHSTPLQRQLSLWPALRQALFTPRVLSAPPLPFCRNPSFHQHLNRDLFPPVSLPKPFAPPRLFYTPTTLAAPRPPPPASQLGSLVRDSGKLLMLDRMLPLLKLRGHRVLMYSQFTKMIDILEEYLTQRRHRYVRLDGSSKLEDRRDMVEDWQTKPEIFVFLLSTRAGGLGINLTSADTVIFYDSDWNPTIDEQAMDRAHRLGQRKTVSVYRLVVEGSVEDKILKRAKMKHYIQSLVVAGGAIDNEALTADEAKDLLLDDEEVAMAKSGQMANGGKKARFSISSTRY